MSDGWIAPSRRDEYQENRGGTSRSAGQATTAEQTAAGGDANAAPKPFQRPICLSGVPASSFSSIDSRETPLVSGTRVRKKTMKTALSAP